MHSVRGSRRLVMVVWFASSIVLTVADGAFSQPIPVDDVGDLPRHTVENEHVTGLLDHSNFTFVGRSNPQGPFPLAARNWTDLYGYAYDGDDPALQGRRFAYVSTGGFSRRGGFVNQHQGGVAIFDVTNEGDPEYWGTYVPPCTEPNDNCTFLIRDIEIHDGIGYFSSDRAVDWNGGTFAVDLRADPLNPPLVAHLNEADFGSQNAVHEIGLDVVGPGEAYLYVNNSVVSGRVDVLSVGDARHGINHVATIDGLSTHGVFAQDGFLYVAGEQTVTVFDVSDVGNGNAPLQGMFNAPGGFTHSSWPDTYVDANGQTRHVLYVTHESSGTDLQVWDVTDVLNGTDPVGAQLITSVTNLDLEMTQGTGPVTNVHNLFLVGDTLFTSWTAAGMVVLDVSDPTQPQVIDTFDTSVVENSSNFVGNFGVNAALGFDRVLLSDRVNGLWVVDVSHVVPEPSALVLLWGWGIVLVSLLRRLQMSSQ